MNQLQSKVVYFKVVRSSNHIPSQGHTNQGYIVEDDWDDYSFLTSFYLYLFSRDGASHKVGSVRIAKKGMKPGMLTPLPKTFETLDESFFSLGADVSYYATLRAGPDIFEDVLDALNDVARNLKLFDLVLDESVMEASLLRFVNEADVRNQYHRVATGGAFLTPFDFKYAHKQSPDPLTFSVKPESRPPTNVHAIIGRNATGKSYLLNGMTHGILRTGDKAAKIGKFEGSTLQGAGIFANLVSVTFSAFDSYDPPNAESLNDDITLNYTYIGLKRRKGQGKEDLPKSPIILANEFYASFSTFDEAKRKLWLNGLDDLGIVDYLSDAALFTDYEREVDNGSGNEIKRAFRELSSGYKIVLLTLAKLVEVVTERSLIVLDEPETHLHPPLLSGFIRALSNLLTYRNGVAIVATHSPVVLQEIPRSCVWKLRRSGDSLAISRPEIETFGENVGTLTREVFGLEVNKTGFHQILQDTTKQYRVYETILSVFDDQLGGEARAQLRALLASSRDEPS